MDAKYAPRREQGRYGEQDHDARSGQQVSLIASIVRTTPHFDVSLVDCAAQHIFVKCADYHTATNRDVVEARRYRIAAIAKVILVTTRRVLQRRYCHYGAPTDSLCREAIEELAGIVEAGLLIRSRFARPSIVFHT